MKVHKGERGGEGNEGLSVGLLGIVGRCKNERAGRLTVESPALILYLGLNPRAESARSRAGPHTRSSPDVGKSWRRKVLSSVLGTLDVV